MFNIFIAWLHSQELPHDNTEWELLARDDLATIECARFNHVKTLKILLYALASRLAVPKLYTAMNRHLVHIITARQTLDIMAHAFTHLAPQDPVLELLVDTWGVMCGERRETLEDEEGWRERVPGVFAWRVTMGVREGRV